MLKGTFLYSSFRNVQKVNLSVINQNFGAEDFEQIKNGPKFKKFKKCWKKNKGSCWHHEDL